MRRRCALTALDRVERVGQKSFYRPVRGRYVNMNDVKPRPAPKMHGVVLSNARHLPYAFIYGSQDAPLYSLSRHQRVAAGKAEVHARFPLRGTSPAAHPELVPATKELFVNRAQVRIARRIDRPKAIPKRGKWIHVVLSEQTLVAYEGDQLWRRNLEEFGGIWRGIWRLQPPREGDG